MKNPFALMFEGVKNKLVDDGKKIGLEMIDKAKQWIADRDEDGDGVKDIDELQQDINIIIDCGKEQFKLAKHGVLVLGKKQAEAATRIAGLFAIYYAKYAPHQKAELVAALPKRDDQMQNIA